MKRVRNKNIDQTTIYRGSQAQVNRHQAYLLTLGDNKEKEQKQTENRQKNPWIDTKSANFSYDWFELIEGKVPLMCHFIQPKNQAEIAVQHHLSTPWTIFKQKLTFNITFYEILIFVCLIVGSKGWEL